MKTHRLMTAMSTTAAACLVLSLPGPVQAAPAPATAHADTDRVQDADTLNQVGYFLMTHVDGEDALEGGQVYHQRADGTGSLYAYGEHRDDYTWSFDPDTGKTTFVSPEGKAYVYQTAIDGETLTYTSEDNGPTLTNLRISEAQAKLMGGWTIVSMGDEQLEPDTYGLRFFADGTGQWIDTDDGYEPLVYSYDAEAGQFTLQIEEETPIVFTVAFDGEVVTLTPLGEDAPPVLVMQRDMD